jgi:hypothetical protein
MTEAPAPAPVPDLTGAAAVRARMAVLTAAPVRRMDWPKTLAACLNFVFNTKARPDMWSSNSEWWLWRQIYLADPAAFRLLGELHNDRETGECYITARYDFGPTGAYACFHLYGTTEGTRFNVTKASWSQNGKRVSTRDLWARIVPGGVNGGAGSSSSASVVSFGSE